MIKNEKTNANYGGHIESRIRNCYDLAIALIRSFKDYSVQVTTTELVIKRREWMKLFRSGLKFTTGAHIFPTSPNYPTKSNLKPRSITHSPTRLRPTSENVHKDPKISKSCLPALELQTCAWRSTWDMLSQNLQTDFEVLCKMLTLSDFWDPNVPIRFWFSNTINCNTSVKFAFFP